ncbi:hypothetical protein QNA24_34765, partial [Rhodococcus qingshengii]|uniref:hypothetical protein n=1 Tax=Rhodococcus qingshengii TaxID=334542 RepID=UPI0024B9E04C
SIGTISATALHHYPGLNSCGITRRPVRFIACEISRGQQGAMRMSGKRNWMVLDGFEKGGVWHYTNLAGLQGIVKNHCL